jgi:secondary thiamine-phosphate synthase enzyme
MEIKTKEISVPSKGHTDIQDITTQLSRLLEESGLSEGNMLVFVSGSTASLSTVEYEPGLIKDVPRVLDKIAPYGPDYAHHDTWHDDNGASHVRATLMGPSITIPFKEKRLLLGQWQQIILLDFDTRERSRELVVQLMGD